jgi:hypothetical protein
MLGRRELLLLLIEVELALLRCDTGTSRCSLRVVAMEIFSRFSCVTAARLDVLIGVDGDDEEQEEEKDEEDDGEDDKEEEEFEGRTDLTCCSSSAAFGRGAALMILYAGRWVLTWYGRMIVAHCWASTPGCVGIGNDCENIMTKLGPRFDGVTTVTG